MEIAYLITAHTDIVQLKRLCYELIKSGDVYLHIDKKVNDSNFISDILSVMIDTRDWENNVYVINERLFLSWAGFSQVKVQRLLLQKSLAVKHKKYDRFVFLSGMCYPIMSSEEIQHEFMENRKKEYICGYNLTRNARNDQKLRYAGYHFFRDLPLAKNSQIKRVLMAISRNIFRVLKIHKPYQLNHNGIKEDIYFGGSWIGLTRDCAEFVLLNLADGSVYTNYFRTSYASDELCIHTIVFNSPFAHNASIPDVDIYGDTQKAFLALSPLHYLHYKDEIKVYTEKDYEEVVSSGKMFVRKIVSGNSDKLILMLDNRKTK